MSEGVNVHVPEKRVETAPGVNVCKFDDGGFCRQHKLIGEVRYVSKDTWVDRGGGKGYGKKKVKVKKYICTSRIAQPANSVLTWLNRASKDGVSDKTKVEG